LNVFEITQPIEYKVVLCGKQPSSTVWARQWLKIRMLILKGNFSLINFHVKKRFAENETLLEMACLHDFAAVRQGEIMKLKLIRFNLSGLGQRCVVECSSRRYIIQECSLFQRPHTKMYFS
jgi:hypothetical protein